MPEDMLEERLRDLVVGTARALASKKASDLPTVRGFALEAEESGKPRLVPADIPSWHQATDLLKPIVGDLLAWPLAVEEAARDPRVQTFDGKWVRGPWFGRKSTALQVPLEFLRDYFACCREFAFRPDLFRQRYREMLRYHDPGASFRAKLTAPLSGFAAEKPVISLGDIRIRQVGVKEVGDIANRFPEICFFYGGMGRWWFSWVLEAEVDVPKNVTVEDTPSVSSPGWELPFAHAGLVNREVVLLRCFTGQPVTARTFVYGHDGWPVDALSPFQVVELPWNQRLYPRGGGDPLSDSDVRKYRLIRRKYLAIDKMRRGPVTAAARRIALADDQPYPGDRVADYVSAMEGLLVEGPAPETQYRFSQRVAFLLGRPGRRKELLGLAKKLYDARSRVVHGEFMPDDYGFGVVFQDEGPKPKPKARTRIVEADQEARRLARLVLRAMINKGGGAHQELG